MSDERWIIVDCSTGYEVSDLGRVRNRARGNILKPNVNNKGRYRVCLGKRDGKFINKFVHRLVATAFIGPGEDMEVNHKDGDPTNNALSNLEWVDRSQNERHSRYVLGNLCEPVVGFHDNGEVRLFASIAHANAELGLHRDAVRRCMSKDYTRHKSFGWSFIRYSMAGVEFAPAPPTSGAWPPMGRNPTPPPKPTPAQAETNCQPHEVEVNILSADYKAGFTSGMSFEAEHRLLGTHAQAGAELPELPGAYEAGQFNRTARVYTANQMHKYVLDDRERRGGS